MEWQPIETAPKDGTALLTWNGSVMTTAYYRHIYGWSVCDAGDSVCIESDSTYPTHWMPLPNQPKES